MIYAGVGSRETPPNVCLCIERLAGLWEAAGWRLRSGGANGADTAFERGVKSASFKSIYLPCQRFNGRVHGKDGCWDASSLPAWPDALATVDEYHPDPGRLSEFARRLMARNAMQVLGPDLRTPADAVICWTPGGAVTGGTGQALRIAAAHKIQIFNLGSEGAIEKLTEVVQSI